MLFHFLKVLLKLKKCLGFALAATAIWLLSVLETLIGLKATSYCAFLLLIVILILVLFNYSRGLNFRITFFAILPLTILTFTLPLWVSKTEVTANLKNNNKWVEFNEKKIQALVKNNKIVIVDITADWCITCKVNKSFVLNTKEVDIYLSSIKAIRMQADWTRPDETVSKYLKKFNRYGIPFNAVYGPNAQRGIALPELLTKSAVLKALKKASLNRD